MCEISVVMAAYNAEKYIGEAIESVLKQSFPDFECIIIDDGSTDNTFSVIQSFKDKRIRSFKNIHDFIGSLNIGMDAAEGKYIARMDADDIMHIDRLKIQQAIMEEDSSVTVCSAWMSPFGNDIPKGTISGTVSGELKSPMLHLLKNNLIVNSSSMMCHDFVKRHALRYDYYAYAEDYKWWVEMAKRGAVFFIEPQPLVFYRISDTQVTYLYKEKMNDSSIKIKKEIINHLIGLNSILFPEISETLKSLYLLKEKKLMTEEDIIIIMHTLFIKNQNILKNEITYN